MNRNPHQGNLVWQLLKCNISRSQLTAYTLSNFIGLSIVLTAIQFYLEVSDTLESDDSFISRDYVVVSPKVSGLGSLSGGEPAMFDSTDIAGIASEPWAWRVGVFTSARFNVDASLDMNGRGMSTSLFFESVPDEFFDTVPPEWTFDPSNPEIPIVISKDYLTLYNFGFASTHGLPQLSEGMTGILPLRVSISGRGRQMWIPARIAGFSSRLNTIAVPEKFMTWANGNFGEGKPVTSRIIVELSRPGDPAIKEYFDTHSMEMAGDKADSSTMAYFLSVLTAIVIAIGATISLLAFFILMLSIHLLLQKNRDRLRDLMLLGYKPSQVSGIYYRLTAAINTAVFIGAVAVMLISRGIWHGALEKIGVTGINPWVSIAVGLAITGFITVCNFASIRKRILSYFS